jgi:hypothetical protein
MYIEPRYWEKEIYALGTLEFVLYGKTITDEKVIKNDKRKEVREDDGR